MDDKYIQTQFLKTKAIEMFTLTGVPSDWLFGTSPNGYMDGELFYKWFESVFLPNVHKCPALLVLDNRESDLTLKLLQRAKTENVELYGLPPHTTHVTQPLNAALFKHLKSKFSDIAFNLGYARKDDWQGKVRPCFSRLLI